MSKSKNILAVGSIAFDSIKTPNGERNKILGGSATFFGIASSYYTNVYLIGVVGEDFTDKEWGIFNSHNINVDSVIRTKGKTFAWGGAYNNDYSHRKTLFTNLGVFENFEPYININYNNPILYLGNIQPQLQIDVINKIKEPNLIVADSMNLWIDLFPNKVWDLISKVNILLLNDEEAIQLTNLKNLNKIADKFLSKGPDVVIIKRGGEGSLLAYQNKKIKISVFPNTKVIDPTGAGDSFAGGFLGYIAKYGLNNLEEAVKHGSAIASYTVSSFGLEQLSHLTKNELIKRVKQIKCL